MDRQRPITKIQLLVGIIADSATASPSSPICLSRGSPRRSPAPTPAPPSVHLWVVVLVIAGSCLCGVEARRNVITHIKGFEGPLPFYLETGYVEVDEEHGGRLFYYFIESERSPAEDPLILWITGGPGCSALSGLLFEIVGQYENLKLVEGDRQKCTPSSSIKQVVFDKSIRVHLRLATEDSEATKVKEATGPLKFDVAGYTEGFPRLVYFQDSWTKVSNVIFLDAPMGTGFSYAREEAGYNISLTASGRQHHTFLRRWLAEHPEFASNPLYLGGDSYSGYTVPVAAMDIANHNDGNDEALRLNLKGYLVGNAGTDNRYEKGGRVPFMHGMGLISDELFAAARAGCGEDFYRPPDPANSRCANVLDAIDSVTSDINPVHILEPFCGLALRDPGVVGVFRGGGGGGRRAMLVRDYVEHPEFLARRKLSLPVECRDNGYRLSYIWADDDEVRAALGVHDGSIGSWSRCTKLTHFWQDIDSVIPYHANLTKAGYRALVYSGDHDLDMTFVGTQAWIRTLNYPIVSDWRPWHSNRQIAGFTRTYAYNLTFATVKGAGHTAPEYRPKECLDMIDRWTSPAGQL
ncbi:hypothetical protein ACP4OV_012927 [Aristida adscensionis]